MQERDLQDYLFENPQVLFPDGTIQEKSREYQIKGKRIDLLFVVDGVRYIIEIKNVPIQREHVGQVIEYYGLLKQYLQEANLKMVLVSPSIPLEKRTYLEELGIRCVEISSIPYQGCTIETSLEANDMIDATGLTMADFSPPLITDRKIMLAGRFANDILPMLRKQCVAYTVTSLSTKPTGPFLHRVLKYDDSGQQGQFTDNAVWFAFNFDFPIGVSAWMMEYGLDVVVNAESRDAQKLFLQRIESNRNGFNILLQQYPVRLELWLKYEHQPKFFHWIPAESWQSGQFNSDAIISVYRSHSNSFAKERSQWIDYIKRYSQLSSGQIKHLQARNKNLNLQACLIHTLRKDDTLWAKPYAEQLSRIYDVVKNLMPYIDFFASNEFGRPLLAGYR